MCAQFAFVEKHDERLYQYMIEVEKNARLRIDTCPNLLRSALERTVNMIIQKDVPDVQALRDGYRNVAKPDRKNKWDLYDKIEALKSPRLMKKSPLPRLESIMLVYQSGKKSPENS